MFNIKEAKKGGTWNQSILNKKIKTLRNVVCHIITFFLNKVMYRVVIYKFINVQYYYIFIDSIVFKSLCLNFLPNILKLALLCRYFHFLNFIIIFLKMYCNKYMSDDLN